MELASKPSRISRVDSRYRHLAQDVSPRKEAVREKKRRIGEEEDREFPESAKGARLIRDQKGLSAMGRAHRMFHRQEPGKETAASPAPAVSAMALPSVPAVPPFPSTLVVPSVPAYPWPSGVPSVVPPGATSQAIITTPVPEATATPSFPTLPSGIGFNSTSASTRSSTRLSSTIRISSTSSISTSLSFSTSSAVSPSTSLSGTVTSISYSTLASSTSSPEGGGGGVPGPVDNFPPPAAATTAASGGGGNNADPPLGTPQVVGSVIGSLAGAALLLVLLLFLIRRHKRKGALQLSGIDTADNQPIAGSGQQMATRSSLPSGAAAFLNRFSGVSRSTVDTTATGERGFQRISGRKLPSAFSEGMTSEQFARGEPTLSGSSFYRDDQGFYGGQGTALNKELEKETGGPSNYGAIGTKERIMPSPARTPVIHHPNDAPPWGTSRNGGSTLSPPHSPNPDFTPKPTLGRSLPSHDGSRSSRFTENV